MPGGERGAEALTLQGCDLSHHNGEQSAPLLDFAIVRVIFGNCVRHPFKH